MEIKLDGVEGSLILIKQGAEARVFESTFVGRRSIVKELFSKKYRLPSLDSKLTSKRLNAEARCMTKARKLGVSTPALYAVDPMLNTLTFEFIEGPSVKDILLDFGLQGNVEEWLDDIAAQIGDVIGKLHDGGLIHGDLTTSNMLIQNSSNKLVLIDFGLSFTSKLPEDKAVDLYVLERALLSMHSSCGNVMEKIECIQKIFKTMVLNPEQVSPSETKRKKANDGWVNSMRREPLSSPCSILRLWSRALCIGIVCASLIGDILIMLFSVALMASHFPMSIFLAA